MTYTIKQIPEDFIVEELLDLKIEKAGGYSYFLLEKKETTTQKAISIIADKLNIDQKFVNYAGAKDKQAITRQYISINNCRSRKDFEFKDMTLKYLGQGKERINLGSNLGNRFTIVVRDLDKKQAAKNEKLEVKQVLNYFDEQRFSKNNVKIGKLILQRKFKDACEIMVDDEKSEHLEKRPTDYIGALKSMNKKTLSLYIHAFQSKIWNDIAKEVVLENEKAAKKVGYSEGTLAFQKDSRTKIKNQKIPLVGFGTELDELPSKMRGAIEKALQENEVSQRDFIIREIPGLSDEGIDRDLMVEVKDFASEYADDELNKGKKKCTLSFSLPSGSYATIVVKSIFG